MLFCLRVNEVLQNNTTVDRHVDEDVSDGRLVACSAARLSSLLLFSCCSAGPGGPMRFLLRPLCLLDGCSSNSRPAGFLRRPAATDVCSSCVSRLCQKDARVWPGVRWDGMERGAWLTFREDRPPPRSRQNRKERRVGKLCRWTQLAAICGDF